jgi:predicted metal-dependent enzyme (double-stranded beta helix superfamily)
MIRTHPDAITPRMLRHPVMDSLPRRRLRPSETAALVADLAADTELWASLVRHDPVTRWHTRLLWTPFAEVYLLGWTADQDTRMHDHGGSVGAFAVTEGQLVEERGRARSAVIDRCEHLTGSVVPFDARHVHNLGNAGPAPATSIHAYSPPLPFMRFYEPDAQGRLRAAYRRPVDGPEPDDSVAPLPLLGDVRQEAGR